MPAFVEVDGSDVVQALVVGGFRVSRRDADLAFVVRGHTVVALREGAKMGREKLLALLVRAGVTEEELVAWMTKLAEPQRTRSGFHRRVRTLAELMEDSKRIRERMAANDPKRRGGG